MIRWQLFVEEFGPKFYYIKGSKNVAADTFLRLEMMNANEVTMEQIEEVNAKRVC
jgi:hypothetical protein